YVVRRVGEPTQRTARGHAANKDLGVRGQILHADAVAQDSAVRERTRRVDYHNTNAPSLVAVLAGQSTEESALAGARGPRDADDMCTAAVRKERAESFPRIRVPVINPSEDAGKGATIAVEDALGDVSAHSVDTSGRAARCRRTDERDRRSAGTPSNPPNRKPSIRVELKR